MTNELNNRPLKYLFLSADKFPPFRVDVLTLFGQEMVKRGHKIDWLLQSEKHEEKFHEQMWCETRVFVGPSNEGESRLSRIKKHFQSIVLDLKVFQLASNNQYDFIQVKDKFLSAIFAIFAARKNKCKFFYWLSYPFPESSIYEAKVGTARYPFLYLIRGYVFKFLLYKIIARWADHIFVQSEQMKKDVVEEGVDINKVTAVPMGVSLDSFKELQDVDDIKFEPQGKVIVYLGTLLSTRKLDFVIRVFALVLEEIPDAKLYMVGPEELPGDMKTLKKEAKRLGITDKIIFTGGLPRPEALAYLKIANVCVSPFYPTPILNSTSPTKLVEYMVMRKPVVANDHPEQSLVISESEAGICVPYEEKTFAQGIVRILLDPVLAKEMGDRGYEYAVKYRTYEYLSGLVEQCYLKLCRGK